MSAKTIVLSLMLAGGLAAAGLTLAGGPGGPAADPPPAVRIVSRHLRVFPNFQGYLQLTEIYRTPAEALAVWRAFARQYGVQPVAEPQQGTACVLLGRTRSSLLLRYIVGVRVCAATTGTSVLVERTLYLTP